MKKLFLAVGIGLLSASAAYADVTPVSYSFDHSTGSGNWSYSDPTLTKLTDGVTGLAGWAVNQGQEWVGWNGLPTINIDFNFGSAKAISGVSIGSTQDNLADVVLPSFAVSALEGGTWVLKGTLINTPSASNNHSYGDIGPHAFYTFSDLAINSQYIRLTLTSNGPYTFIDEVRFQAAAVPEPETYAMMMAGLGLLGLIARRRQTRQS